MQPEDMDNIVAKDGIFLKELVRAVKNKDQVRAQALLRSLGSGKYKEVFEDPDIKVYENRVKPIGYNVKSNVMSPESAGSKGVLPTADLSFQSTRSGYSQPSPKGAGTPKAQVTPLKRAALWYALGDALGDWPEKTSYDIIPTDERRARLYRMKTQGAFAPIPGDTRIQGIRRKEDVFQPRVEKGRFGKQVQFNPESLKQDLINMAAGRGLAASMRQMLPPKARIAAEAGLMLDDFLRSMTGKGISDVYNEASERFTESDDYWAVP